MIRLWLFIVSGAISLAVTPPNQQFRRDFFHKCAKYQTTDLTLEVTFTMFDFNALIEHTKTIYINKHITFLSSNPQIAHIENNLLIAKDTGQTEISIRTAKGAPIIITSELISVTNSVVSVTSLSISAVTHLNATVSQNNQFVTIMPIQYLTTREHRIANVSIYANYDDGHYQDITNSDTDLLTIHSLYPECFQIIYEKNGPQIEVTKETKNIHHCHNILGKKPNKHAFYAVWKCSSFLPYGYGTVQIFKETAPMPYHSYSTEYLVHPTIHALGDLNTNIILRNYASLIGRSKWTFHLSSFTNIGLYISNKMYASAVSISRKCPTYHNTQTVLYDIYHSNNGYIAIRIAFFTHACGQIIMRSYDDNKNIGHCGHFPQTHQSIHYCEGIVKSGHLPHTAILCIVHSHMCETISTIPIYSYYSSRVYSGILVVIHNPIVYNWYHITGNNKQHHAFIYAIEKHTGNSHDVSIRSFCFQKIENKQTVLNNCTIQLNEIKQGTSLLIKALFETHTNEFKVLIKNPLSLKIKVNDAFLNSVAVHNKKERSDYLFK